MALAQGDGERHHDGAGRLDGTVFAVDVMRGVPVERLLDRTARAPAEVMRSVRTTIVDTT